LYKGSGKGGVAAAGRLAAWPVILLACLLPASCSNPWTGVEPTPAVTALRESLQQPKRILHGNYCGFGTVDGTLRSAPTDRLDAVCQKHDICYIEGQHHCICDEELRHAVTAIIEDPATADSMRRKASLVRSTFALPFCRLFPQGVMPPRDKRLLDEVNPGSV
jgi:hypothetical protein